MASERANWLKAYRRKNKKAGGWNDANTVKAYNRWKAAKSGGEKKPAGLPEGWGTDRTGIAGSWKDKPNLNVDDWETAQNSDGLWFGRRRTELTGLDPWMKQSIGKWDRDAAARAALTKAAGDQATSAVRAVGQAGAKSASDLATLINTKMQGNAEASAGSGAMAAAQQLAATQAATSAQQAAEAKPGIAQYAMQSLANRQASTDSAKRQELVNAYRKLKSAEAEAQSEAIAQNYSDQARLIAAAIQSGASITREQLSQMGQNFRNTQDNETSVLNNNVDAAVSSGNNANTTTNSATNARRKSTQTFITSIPNLLEGKASIRTNPTTGEVESVTEQRAPMNPQQVINQAIAMKIPMGSVITAMNARPELRNQSFRNWLVRRLRASGYGQGSINAVLRALP